MSKNTKLTPCGSLPARVNEGHEVFEGVLVALGDHDHVNLGKVKGGREGVQQLSVDGAPTTTDNDWKLGELGGAVGAAEVVEDVVEDNLVTVMVTLPPVADHTVTEAENIHGTFTLEPFSNTKWSH